jgi:hypothetical protein
MLTAYIPVILAALIAAPFIIKSLQAYSPYAASGSGSRSSVELLESVLEDLKRQLETTKFDNNGDSPKVQVLEIQIETVQELIDSFNEINYGDYIIEKNKQVKNELTKTNTH